MQNNNQNVLTNDQKDEGLKVWDGPEIDEEHDDREVAVKVEHVTMRFTLSREKVDNLKEFAINSLNINLFTTILLRSTTSALRLKRATVLPFSD